MNRRKFISDSSALVIAGGLMRAFGGIASAAPIEEYGGGKTAKIDPVAIDPDVKTITDTLLINCSDVGFFGSSALAVLLQKPVGSLALFGDTGNISAVRRSIATLGVDYIPTVGGDGMQIQFGYKNTKYLLVMTKPEHLAQKIALVKSPTFGHDLLIYSLAKNTVWDPYASLNAASTKIQLVRPGINANKQIEDMIRAELLSRQMGLPCDTATGNYVSEISSKRIVDEKNAVIVLNSLIKSLPAFDTCASLDSVVAFASRPVFVTARAVVLKSDFDFTAECNRIATLAGAGRKPSAIVLAALLGGEVAPVSGEQAGKIEKELALSNVDQNLINLFMINNHAGIGIDSDNYSMLTEANELHKICRG